MHKRATAVAALAVALVLTAVTAAFAVQALTASVSKPMITYRHPTRLSIVAGEKAEMAIKVECRYIGETEWTEVRLIPAYRAAETASYAMMVKPKMNAEYRAVQDAVESNAVAVSVKARLSKPVVRATVKAGKTVTIKGYIWPGHEVGSKAVVLKAYRPEVAWVKGHRKVKWMVDPSASIETEMVTEEPLEGHLDPHRRRQRALDVQGLTRGRGPRRLAVARQDRARARATHQVGSRRAVTEPRRPRADARGLSLSWWRRADSNRRPLPCEGSALPTEPRPRVKRPCAQTRRRADDMMTTSPTAVNATAPLLRASRARPPPTRRWPPPAHPSWTRRLDA